MSPGMAAHDEELSSFPRVSGDEPASRAYSQGFSRVFPA